MEISTKKVIFLAVSVGTMGALLAAAMFGQAVQQESVYKYLSVFSEVFSIVRTNYVDEVSPDTLVDGAFQGVTQAVDEFSYYVPPADMPAYREFLDAKDMIDPGMVITKRFGYAFVQPEGSSYPPICEMNTIDGPVRIDGAGGVVTLEPFRVNHGDIDALGFRIAGLAYLPDVAHIPEAAWPALHDLDIWIVDALRRAPHPSHAHLARTLAWIDRARPARAILTNMHVDLDHATVDAETPPHVTPAHDGMVLTLPST